MINNNKSISSENEYEANDVEKMLKKLDKKKLILFILYECI